MRGKRGIGGRSEVFKIIMGKLGIRASSGNEGIWGNVGRALIEGVTLESREMARNGELGKDGYHLPAKTCASPLKMFKTPSFL